MSSMTLAKQATKQMTRKVTQGMVGCLPDAMRQNLRRGYRAAKADAGLIKSLLHDWRRYRRYSGVRGCTTRAKLEARMIKTYHRIEKGLALPMPRLAFGQDAISLLLGDLREYVARFGVDRTTCAALNTLYEYQRFNLAQGCVVPGLEPAIASVAAIHAAHREHCHGEGGTISISREQIHAAARHDMRAFFEHRYSVRQFSTQPVSMTLIEAAVRMAQNTPSVCNREAGRVYVVQDKQRQARLLGFQNGNRGFGEYADKILILGADLACFHTVGERYQAWIDGGLFSMSLIYALHSLGLGSCCLNWSVEPAVDSAFRAEAGLPEDLQIMMLLAVGHLPATMRVAQSPRRPLAQVLQVLD